MSAPLRFIALALAFASLGSCKGDVVHPPPHQKNTVDYCKNASSDETNCMACTSKPGCGYCGVVAPGEPFCQPGTRDDSTPSSCKVPLVIDSTGCPPPPPPAAKP